MFTIINAASQHADSINYNRTSYSVLASAMSEMGELAQEVAVFNDHSYREVGPYGIIGETVDVIVSLLDLLHVCYPDITEDQLNSIVQHKCVKWLSKVEEHIQ